VNYKAIQAVLMEHYHQPYSEIDEIRLDDCMFFMCLKEAKSDYEQQLIDEANRKAKAAAGRR